MQETSASVTPTKRASPEVDSRRTLDMPAEKRPALGGAPAAAISPDLPIVAGDRVECPPPGLGPEQSELDDLSTSLGFNVYDQETLEQDVMSQIDKAVIERESNAEKRRLEKARAQSASIKRKLDALRRAVSDSSTKLSQRLQLRSRITELEEELSAAREDENEVAGRIDELRRPKSLPAGQQVVKQDLAKGQDAEVSEEDAEIRREAVARVTSMALEEQYMSDSDVSDGETSYSGVNYQPEHRSKTRRRHSSASRGFVDDGDETYYRRRVQSWARRRHAQRAGDGKVGRNSSIDPETEARARVEGLEDDVVDERFRIPAELNARLFLYQKHTVKWLWELHCQEAGGILADEMGLGKTIQIIAFLGSLWYSGLMDSKPTLIVCPATLMKQWVREFHMWWPLFRCIILHSTGEGAVKYSRKRGDSSTDDAEVESIPRRSQDWMRAALRRVKKSGHVVVTTYAQIKSRSTELLEMDWGYVILDEGHHIRNPNANVTLAAKQLRTPHRIIISGTPIQNNLTELWSLFDFVFPGRLGTLPVFDMEFAIPINLGGYANATNVQVRTAFKCAKVLRELINPYLLRRLKSQVAADLPEKTEQVLFCRLTKAQVDIYKQFLRSEELAGILRGTRHVLYGIDILRKVCNHPDLLLLRDEERNPLPTNYGDPSRSGKLVVVKQLLQLWQSQEHKVLVFTQTRQMLDILEKMIAGLEYTYLRMDGTTPIKSRMTLVDTFNREKHVFVFLLTTKVGGLGVNLVGANRVIIFDPDWNPSIDVQARERAWRLGQKRPVTVYRLMTSGTIEEKMYHRQIFKQFLTNKILKDARQKRFFKFHDLRDLFSLSSHESSTAAIFRRSGVDDNHPHADDDDDALTANLDADPISELPQVAHMDEFKPSSSGQCDREAVNLKGESRVLKTIFEQADVDAVVHHDRIVDADRHEDLLIEQEANRVAERAIAALKESRERVRATGVSTPTWTGRFGTGGLGRSSAAPPPPLLTSRAGPPSSSAVSASSHLLGKIRQRLDTTTNPTPQPHLNPPPHEPHPGASPSTTTITTEQDLLITHLRDYIASRGGSATTHDIVQTFRARVEGTDAALRFRLMLKGIAELRRDRDGRKRWALKAVFR